MANVVREAKYIKSDVKNNNNKYWYIRQYDDNSVVVEYGRVGSNPQVDNKSFGSESSATSFVDKKCREKEGAAKGYTKLKVISGNPQTTPTSSTGAGSLLDIALKQIENSSIEAADLIRYLTKANVHNIVNATTMTYDESKGTFSTPCGIVTQEGIDEARALLDELLPYVEAADYENIEFIVKLQNYIQLIPRKVGRKLIASDIFPNIDAFGKEVQILDSLDASLQQVLTAPTEDGEEKKEVELPRLFKTKLDLVKDQKIIDHIIKFFNSTKQNIHTSSVLKVKRVFSVEISDMSEGYTKDGVKVGGVMELWHGTRVSNVLSILKSGLMIPKSNAPHVCGRMFGDGAYFSDQSTKSLNYAQGYWNGSRDNNCFMFLADVAMGKYFVPSGPSQNFPKPGYDSTFAQGGKSGVMNNEMIVYRLGQCNLKYLIEFSDK